MNRILYIEREKAKENCKSKIKEYNNISFLNANILEIIQLNNYKIWSNQELKKNKKLLLFILGLFNSKYTYLRKIYESLFYFFA